MPDCPEAVKVEKEKNFYLLRGKNRAGREEICHTLMEDFCEPRKPVPFQASQNTLCFCLCLLKTSSCCRGAFHPFRATAGNVKNSRKTGKSLPDKKKIAKPLFCHYSAPAFLSSTISNGQVSEWSNEHAWKVCVLATVPRVRIPPCPPSIFRRNIFVMSILRFLFVGAWGRNGGN